MKNRFNGFYKGMVALAAMVLMTGSVWAGQIVVKGADENVAFRVYNGYTGTLYIGIAGAGTNFGITCDGNSNNFSGATYGTNAVVTPQIVACTNAAGEALLKVDDNASLTNDLYTAKLLTGTYSATAGKWVDVYWDTSACLHYDLYLKSRTYQSGQAPYVLEKVQGQPTGTGNVTISIYKARTLVAQQVITSPVYVMGVSGTNDMGTVNTVNVDWNVDLPFAGDEAVIVRAARATTATTGIIGAVIK